MNVNYIVTYDSVTRLILKCVPAGGTYPAEGATGVENQAILHQKEEIEGNLGFWCDMHWVDEAYNILHKGPRPDNDYWDWVLETRAWKFNSDRFWSHVRAERNIRLARSDWTQFADAPITEAQQEEWKIYRTVLRDLPKDNIDVQSMNAIPWPTPPNNEKIEITVW